MKRDDMDIDEILKRYLPRAPQEEVEAAGERVLERIRSMRFRSAPAVRSEEHTSELQSHHDLVCRLLLEKKKESG